MLTPLFLGQIKVKVKVKVDPNSYSQNFGWTPTLGNFFGFKVQVGTLTLTTEYVHTYGVGWSEDRGATGGQIEKMVGGYKNPRKVFSYCINISCSLRDPLEKYANKDDIH